MFQMQLYEEFLSRSSTRAALKKGGNFMGMMNVLMQLRKVCNHPDLFEARSIITPFVVPSLRYTIPSFLYTVKTTMSAIDNVSETLIQPIWCGSTGLPSITAALRHNQIESKQLRRLRTSLDKEALLSVADENDQDCPDELKTLLKGVHALRRSQKAEKIDFHNTINSRRCLSSEFPYSSQLLDSVKIDVNIFDRSEPVELNKRNIVSTPAALLRMRRKEQERANQLDGTIEKFVFCVPKAGARPLILATTGPMPQEYSSRYMKEIEEVFMDPLEIYLKPGRKAHARLSSFFPDKKFIQYDAGKLQILAELLRKLKRGGHRCLIFTQMSKMLDILEAFLNIHGHTYLRLDGATGVDRRQRYMDRFNNDTKVFCFILSTRSGGMGINLTGADTVIFYDSDWNPAMDAQAQDRAHRIGQTREVHIYRLITEHSIEENILMKAKQKRNLDIMVMDQGKFDASQQQSGDVADQVKNVYTKGGLRAILGVTEDYPNNHDDDIIEQKEAADMSNEQMEQAMASLEDEDDAQALRGAQKEAAEELEEFDENAEIKRDEDEGDDENDARDDTAARPIKRRKGEEDIEANDKKSGEEQKSQENDLEKEFVALQNTVGIDASTIDSALSPMEKYALNFREDIDPFFSIFYINEHNRKLEVSQIQDDIDIEGIERGKAIEERQAMDDGDLLATRPRPESLIRQRNLYQRERLRLRSGKKRRKLTGEAWSSKIDGLTKKPFWYNADTGEAIWNKPIVLLELEANDLALEKGWGFLPTKDLVNVMEFLIPFPDRQRCSAVCRQWRAAANDIRFVRHVYPVEMGAITGANQLHNHFNTIADALAVALPGDTIELSDGHYWVTEPGLLFDKPVKVIGDDNNASNVVIEMSGTLEWAAKGGWMEGVTFRRPKISTGAPVSYSILKMTGKAKIDIFHCVFDNGGSTGSTIALSGSGAKGSWNDIVVRNGGTNGIEIEGELSLDLRKVSYISLYINVLRTFFFLTYPCLFL
jgi:superfamily II DNA/RNA helicase